MPWDQVPKEHGHPVSYSASGSHASYPGPGHDPIAHGLATDEAADGGRHEDVEQHLRPGPGHYPLPGGAPIPAGARIGEDKGARSAAARWRRTPAATGSRSRSGPTPIEGKPDTGDGLDGDLRGVLDAAGSPITIGQDAVGLLPGL